MPSTTAGLIPGSKTITQTYSTTARGHEIKLDAIVPPKLLDSKDGAAPAPVLIAWHGGGLINGSRVDPYINEPIVGEFILPQLACCPELTFCARSIAEAAAKNGWLLICPDYRLVFPSNGFDIADDVDAFFDYITSSASADALPGNVRPDLSRVAVTGFSAGGHLTRLSMMRAFEESQKSNPRFVLRCNVPIVAMAGDYTLDWWTVERHEAAEPPLSDDDRQKAKVKSSEGVKHLQDKTLPEVSCASYTEGLEGHDIAVTREHVWPNWGHYSTILDTLTGIEGLGAKLGKLPHEERVKALDPKLARAIPQIWYRSLRDSKPANFPPTLLVHGTRDEAVPYEESVNNLKDLEAAGLPAELITVKGGNHNAEVPETGKRVAEWDEFNARIVAFFEKHLA